MADFPTIALNPESPNVVQEDRPIPTALEGVGRDLDQFGSQLSEIANRAAAEQGRQTGAADVLAGKINPQSPVTIYGQAYNEVAKQQLGTQRKAAMMQQMGELFAQHSDDPKALSGALDNMRQGYKPTPWKDLDADLQGQFLIQSADYLNRANLGLKERMTQSATANFADTLNNGTQLLDTTAAGASFDDSGWARVTAAMSNLEGNLTKFGPRTEFSAGGKTYPADETRGGMISPVEIQQALMNARSEAKRTWIYNQALRLPTAAAQQQFVGELRQKYAANDPMFAGLQGQEWDALDRKLMQLQDHTQSQEWTEQTKHGQTAAQMIDALRYGADVDTDKMVSEAQASGNAGIVAQARFYQQVDRETPGVFKSVVRRAMGLTGGDGGQWVDASGNPVDATGSNLGLRNNNPGNVKAIPHGWRGQTGVDEHGYAQFSTPQAGMATAEQNLLAKQDKHGLRTVRQIIAAPGVGWDPGEGAKTEAYVRNVSAALGVNPDDPVDVHDPAVRHHMLEAIFQQETGRQITMGNPWQTPPGVKPGSPAFEAWANAKEGFSSDPIGYSHNKGIAPVSVLVPAAWAAHDPAAQQAWTKSLQQRFALGQMLTQTRAAPARMLTNGEREYYKTQLEQDPAQILPLVETVRGAVGDQGALAFAREIGQDKDASVVVHIADIAARGSSGFAQSAVRGLAAEKSEGYDKSPAYKPGEQKVEDLAPTWAPAFAHNPDALAAAIRTANLARKGDALTGQVQSSNYYLSSAIGATTRNGKLFGGVESVNGSPTVLPSWLANGSGSDAMRALGDSWAAGHVGPVWSNGQPVDGRSISRMQMILGPDGRYGLLDPKTGAPARRANGSVFTFDMDKARPFLRNHLPEAVFMSR